jgi:hypothetical protein
VKRKVWKKIFYVNGNPKIVGIDKIHFQSKSIKKQTRLLFNVKELHS